MFQLPSPSEHDRLKGDQAEIGPCVHASAGYFTPYMNIADVCVCSKLQDCLLVKV